MSISVLISIRPEWCEKIASGEKTIEVRKSRPTIQTPFKCYIYCTKPKYPHEDFLCFDAGTAKIKAFYGGGLVIGEFVCDKIWDVCIACSDPGNGETGYGWHISDLVIYDKPKELSEFYRWGGWSYFSLERPPQSWCYVEEVTHERILDVAIAKSV